MIYYYIKSLKKKSQLNQGRLKKLVKTVDKTTLTKSANHQHPY